MIRMTSLDMVEQMCTVFIMFHDDNCESLSTDMKKR